MDLNEKAERRPEVLRAVESHGTYRLETTELTPADELTPEDEFPEYGDFAEVFPVTKNGDGFEAIGSDPQYLETPAGLARELVEHLVDEGTVFEVTEASKTQDDEWTFTVERLKPSDE